MWGDEEDSLRISSFDDPAANERNFLVTFAVSRAWGPTGRTDLGPTVDVRVGIYGNERPADEAGALLAMDHVVAFLDTWEGAVNDGDWKFARAGSLVGVVGADESVEFPGFPDAASHDTYFGVVRNYSDLASRLDKGSK